MVFYRRRYEQFHRAQPSDLSVPLAHQYAGANARIPEDVQSILDVGCGDGKFLRGLPASYHKIGVDIAWEPLPQLGHQAVQASIGALPFAAASFDLVTCFEVLEHLPYPAYHRALSELERVSRKHIIVSVPNREILSESLVWCPSCSCAFNPSWHVRSFDSAALVGLFSGFRLVEYRSCGPEVRYGGSLLAGAAVLLARRKPPPAVACPQCGYSLAGNNNAALDGTEEIPRKSCVPDGLRNASRRLLFRDRRPYWLLAYYRRRDASDSRPAC